MRTQGQSYDFLTYPCIEDLIAISSDDRFNIESEIFKNGVIVYDRADFVA
jgi:hypothetical protein